MCGRVRERHGRGAAKPSGARAPGTPVVGRLLTCRPGSWAGMRPIVLSYRWLRNGKVIAGALGNQRRLRAADGRKLVACQVWAGNASGAAHREIEGLLVRAARASICTWRRATPRCPCSRDPGRSSDWSGGLPISAAGVRCRSQFEQLGDRLDIRPQTVVTRHPDYLPARRGGRNPDGSRSPWTTSIGTRTSSSSGRHSQAQARPPARRLQREGEAQHRDRARRVRRTACNAGAERASADDQRQPAQLVRNEPRPRPATRHRGVARVPASAGRRPGMAARRERQ